MKRRGFRVVIDVPVELDCADTVADAMAQALAAWSAAPASDERAELITGFTVGLLRLAQRELGFAGATVHS